MLRWPLVVMTCSVVVLGGLFLGWEHLREQAPPSPRVEFNRDIRPILNQNCTSCHGGVKRLGDVSFTYREETLGRGKSGKPTVVPGNARASELMARVTAQDPEIRMPQHAPPLRPQQIELLRQWIEEGAQWEDHWAFVPPKPQPLPQVRREEWVRQPLDRFVLARLEHEGLEPSPEADKATLLRRVSFDLTGLPPSPQELSAFLSDSSSSAYERQVDRLLASPHYGERWAALWLDLARYTDNRSEVGMGARVSWPYRDWVIDSFNRNLSYDRFVITQLAGDLFPNPSLGDLIATSFQRQTGTSDGADSDNEEFRLLAVMDRVATTWSALNGLTMNCVQCHSHPYDPLRHAEYYKFLAFYNTTRDADLPEDSPLMPYGEPSRRQEVAQIYLAHKALLREIVDEGRRLAANTNWTSLPIQEAHANELLGLERAFAKLQRAKGGWGAPNEFIIKLTMDNTKHNLERVRKSPAKAPLKIKEGEIWAELKTPLLSVYELQTEALPPSITALRIEVPPVNADTARHTPEESFIIGGIEAWVVSPAGKEQEIEWASFAFDSEENLAQAVRQEISSPKANSALGNVGGFASHGKLFHTRWLVAVPRSPLAIEAGSRLKMRITHTVFAAEPELRPDPSNDPKWMQEAESQASVIRTAQFTMDAGGKPTIAMRVRLTTTADPSWTNIAAPGSALAAKRAQLNSIDGRLARTATLPLPLMEEQPPALRPDTLQFERGNMLTKTGATLSPDVPGAFPQLPENAPRTRLTMAQWFFGPQQPLTARVAVNRFWEQLFGIGIVETLEDFGTVGQLPSHPELLDWLALHFQNDLKWDIKALLRELVTSATYRQSAVFTPALKEKDPKNRLLARGPQQRLTAEMVLDQALMSSGLLDARMGGPPVKVPQIGPQKDNKSVAQSSHRRAIYIAANRGSIYPSFMSFDASSHELSLARRIPTNTPQQALITLNEPIYYEAAAALARRMAENLPRSSEGAGKDLQAAFDLAAQSVLSRGLATEEFATLEALYRDVRKMSSGPQRDIKALTAVAAVLLNLDAALVR